jgi:hypothetical protein
MIAIPSLVNNRSHAVWMNATMICTGDEFTGNMFFSLTIYAMKEFLH